MSSAIVRALPKQYSTFSPIIIPGCGLWLDGADPNGDGIVTNATSISTWVDKSRNGRNAVNQTTAGVVYTNIRNSRPVMRFNNTQYLVSYPSFPNTAYTIFSVHYLSSNATPYASMIMGGGSTTGKIFIGVGAGGSNISTSTGTNAGFNDTNENASFAYTNFLTWRVVSMVVSGSLSPFVDGNSQTGKTGTTDPLSSITIGSAYSPPGGQNWTGDCAEIIIYESVLTALQRQQVEGYLSAKWGLRTNFPARHPYKTLPLFTRPLEPVDIENCVLWLDGTDSSMITRSGSNVTQWIDKSGIGNNTNSVGSVAPTYTGSGVSFTGGINSGMAGPIILTGTGFTAFVVFTFDASQPGGSSYNRIASFTQTGVLDFNGTNRSAAIMQNNTAFSLISQRNSILGNSTGTFTPGTPFLACTTYNNTNVITYLNGTGSTPAASTGSFSGVTQYLIGNATSTYSSFIGTKGVMHDMIMFSRILTTVERVQIEGYLAWKWGIQNSLPSGQSFKLFRTPTTLFNPRQLNSCTLWYDASDASTITYAAGSSVNVTNVTDKSGNAINLSRVYTTGREITTANTMNGLNTLTFPGDPANNNATLTYLRSTTSISVNANVNYCFFVMRFNPYVLEGTATERGWGLVFPMVINVARGMQGGLIRTAGSWYFNYNVAQTGSAATGSAVVSNRSNGPATGTPLIGMFGKTAAATYVFSYNGNYESKSGVTYSIAGGQPLLIGIYYQGQELCEMIMFQSVSALSRQQIQQIEGYLAAKWGLQYLLPTTHPYYKTRA